MDNDYPPDKILRILKSSRLFNQFTDTQLIHFISFSHIEQFKKNTKIIKEKERNQNLYILLEGSVAVYVGDELIIKLKRKGDIIGEMSVITKSLTTASVVADSFVTLFTIPAQKIYTSKHVELHSLWFKIFSDILTEKLTKTTRKVIGFQETSAELTIKKRELIEKSIILQSVLGSMVDGVVVADAKGELLHVNDAFIKLIGNIDIPDRFSDWPCKIGFFKPDKTTIYPVEDLPMEKAKNGELIISEEIYVKNINLESGIWLQASSSFLKTDNGKELDGTVVVFRDFTKKKISEQELIKAKESAEMAAKAKSDFLSVVSHELRTPLNGILGMSDLLKTTKLTQEQKECIHTIDKSGQALLSKIQNILYYNQLETNKLWLQKEVYSIKEVIDHIILQTQSLAQENGVSIRREISREADIKFLGDKEKIKQVLHHLIHNAVKFTKNGKVEVICTICREELGMVEFEFAIKDTGIGLSKEQIDALFQPFSQADSSYSRKFEGTGLGLAISKRLVQMMGGGIQVESIPQKGSCFKFNVVQSISSPPTAGSGIATNGNSELLLNLNKDFSQKKPLSILVAEDNKVNQLLIKKVLAKLGYVPDIAENGLKAVEAVQKKVFDVILMDIQMPEMDGLEATRQILNIVTPSNPPKIIALTANTTEDIQDRCFKAGMSDFMLKPLKIERLMEILEKI